MGQNSCQWVRLKSQGKMERTGQARHAGGHETSRMAGGLVSAEPYNARRVITRGSSGEPGSPGSCHAGIFS